MKDFIGKFVCYDQMDGGACWGRIKDEAIVNTMKGEKEVFILEHRYVRYWRTKNVKNFRKFFPGFAVDDFTSSSPMIHETSEGEDKAKEEEELFLEVRKVRGDSTLRKEMIDLDNDIVDLDDILGVVDDETLFKAILSAKAGADVSGKNAMEIGLNALLKEKELSDIAVKALKKRLES
jgi:hypothetical protein